MTPVAPTPVRAQPDNPKPAAKPEVRVLRPDELERLVPAWDELALRAIAPNAFYESWFLLPALKYLADAEDLYFVAVFGPQDRSGSAALWGFFPVQFHRGRLALPFRCLSFWQHEYCFLTVPLIDRQRVNVTLDLFWRWFESNPFKAHVLDTNHILGEGPFHHEWSEFVLGRGTFTLSDYARAMLLPSETGAEGYLNSRVSRKHLDEFRRLERRLGEKGVLRYRQIDELSALDTFLDQFISIEARGWKGAGGGGAFARQATHEAFFRQITRAAYERGRAMLLELSLDGRPIALKHNLLAGEGGFTFKIAFDEQFSRFSPGLLLELENIRYVHSSPHIHWLDSCASPRHPMANRIWGGRRTIRRSLISDGSRRGDFVLATLPAARWLKRCFVETSTPSYLQISTRQPMRS